MKKLAVLCLAALVLVCFSACGEQNEVNSSDPSSLQGSTSSENSSSQTESSTDAEKILFEVNAKAQKIIDEQTDDSMTDVEKAKAVYEWLYHNFKYRAITVDMSKGYTRELTAELAEYYFKYYKGSCEHYAAAQKVFLDLLGFETYYIDGERIDSGTGEWGEHLWLIVHYEGAYYHVDGLFGGNHTSNLFSMFCVPDSAIESTHRWDKNYFPACTEPQLLV
ncbi:MAG: transglutaminase domain-containing protein [Ruminococcaceae bacterium]|nr:transglutaminase domain-containing protein [Oscillospiraceae bacterium]